MGKKQQQTADELWRAAIVDTMKTMSDADFADLIRQRDAASQPAPTADQIPPAPRADQIPPAPRAESLPMSAQASIEAKREQARALGRTTL